MSLPCLILAAGFGTRMGALTADHPKPLIEIAGRSLLDHALDVARDAGAGPIAANAHYKADQIAAHLVRQADVTLLHETPDILDSGGAVKNAAHNLPEGPIATLNADNVWTGANPISQLQTAFDAALMGALLLLVPRDHAVGREGGGDFAMDSTGRLTFDKTDGGFVYTGAQILDPTPCLSDTRDVFSLRDIWEDLSSQGRLFGKIHTGTWADVGHPDGITAAEHMLRGADV
ncbi:MAG: nucleotidyltransferase family protein [Roseicyclus sp.]|nr:nucleotidyltransferase family protein [Roseicyclus sp.]